MLFFPINHDKSHWFLIVAFMQQKIIVSYDSMASTQEKDNYRAQILRWLACEKIDKKSDVPFDEKDWTLANGGNHVPEQCGGYDCGVFTCMAAEYLSNNLPLVSYSQDDVASYRVRMAYYIMRTSLLAVVPLGTGLCSTFVDLTIEDDSEDPETVPQEVEDTTELIEIEIAVLVENATEVAVVAAEKAANVVDVLVENATEVAVVAAEKAANVVDVLVADVATVSEIHKPQALMSPFRSLPWHCFDQTELRASICKTVGSIMLSRRPNATSEWKEKLPMMSAKLEQALYDCACSLEEYADLNTVAKRMASSQVLATCKAGSFIATPFVPTLVDEVTSEIVMEAGEDDDHESGDEDVINAHFNKADNLGKRKNKGKSVGKGGKGGKKRKT
jgi:hypothetical protein